MATSATLSAIAKALDRVFVRLDSIEERQIELAKNQRQLFRRMGKLEKEVAVIRKTLDRLIDYTADIKFGQDEQGRAISRLRERSEKTFDHFDVVVDIVEKQKHELASLHERQDRLEAKVVALAK